MTTPQETKDLKDVPGWFPVIDQDLFTWVLERQRDLAQWGDLLELGAYLGKSAILTGRHLRAAELFTVCDLFDSDAPDAENAKEMNGSYRSLTRVGFEENYLAFHARLPEIIEAPTSQVLEHVKPDSCRFVHIDASHLYEHVRGDLATARAVLKQDGIVVCDDYRSPHTPGVSAAVWEAVADDGLRVICVTTQKLYGTWGDPEPVRRDLLTWLEGPRGPLARGAAGRRRPARTAPEHRADARGGRAEAPAERAARREGEHPARRGLARGKEERSQSAT